MKAKKKENEVGHGHGFQKEIRRAVFISFFLSRLRTTHRHLRIFMRMDFDPFDDKIVDCLSERLYKKDTIMRECVKPAEMCCLAVRYLATGESFRFNSCF